MPVLGHGVFFAEVVEGEHLRVVREVGHERTDRERSPTGREGNVFLDGEMLLRKYQHGMVQEGAMHGFEVGIGHGGKIQPLDDCADVRGERSLVKPTRFTRWSIAPHR